MGDPMMPSVLYSVADELSAIGVLDDCNFTFATKTSPGHESVTSCDSGFPFSSPTHSDVLSNYDADCTHETLYNDIMKPNTDLIDYLTNEAESQDGEIDIEERMGVLAGEDEVVCFNSLSDDNGLRSDTSDLSQLMSSVAKHVTPGGNSDKSSAGVASNGVGRPRRAVRATKGGKTIVLAQGRVAPATTGPVTRGRVARVTASQIAQQPSLKSVSEHPDECSSDDKCQNKNALQARVNRQRKKVYIEGLESQVAELTTENKELKKTQTRCDKDVASLKEEVAYLKSVIINESALSGMLQNISNISAVHFSTSFEASRKRTASELDHDYLASSSVCNQVAPHKRKRPATSSRNVPGGICLHVDNGAVSMEFCAKCAMMANGEPREAM